MSESDLDSKKSKSPEKSQKICKSQKHANKPSLKYALHLRTYNSLKPTHYY